jgi:hypothetical protein
MTDLSLCINIGRSSSTCDFVCLPKWTLDGISYLEIGISFVNANPCVSKDTLQFGKPASEARRVVESLRSTIDPSKRLNSSDAQKVIASDSVA